jgi:hypothetical protein
LQLFKKFHQTFPIVQTVSAQFENTKGQTLPAKSNSGKMQAVLAQFSEKAISSIPKLNWSHLVRLLTVKNEEERNFYIIETAQNTWSTRELDRQINSSLFERLVLSKDKKAIRELSEKGHEIATHQDLLKDPLVLEFLKGSSKNSFFT